MDAANYFYQYRPAAHFLVTDEDAADFLQSQFSNELRPFEPGRCCYGLWLDVKGKVIADSVVLCEGEERFRVLSECCPGEVITAHMQRHIIADEVVIEPAGPAWAFQLFAGAVTALGWTPLQPGQFETISGGRLYCVRDQHYTIVLESESAAEACRARLLAAGFAASSETEQGLARLAAGIPLVPDEIGPADLPGEGGLQQDAISFTKGCYLGQEVVARMHNLGKPQRGLFIVTGQGSLPSVPCALYNEGAKQVGELRTAYSEAAGDAWRGVAILKTRYASEGERLHSDAEEVMVAELLRKGPKHD